MKEIPLNEKKMRKRLDFLIIYYIIVINLIDY